MQELGQRLRKLREGVGLSQNKLAQIFETRQSSINRYEQGQTIPGPEIAIKYADYFDVSLDYIYCRTENPQGKLYNFQPQALQEKVAQNEQLHDFIEMCFDPQSPVNGKLKEALFRLMEEERN